MMLRSLHAIFLTFLTLGTKLYFPRQASVMTSSPGLLLLLLLLLVLPGPLVTAAAGRSSSAASTVGVAANPSASDCDRVQKVYVNKGLPMEHVSRHPIPGGHLTVCSGSMTCCTKAMEQSLVLRSAQDIRTAMVNQVRASRTQLRNRRDALDAYMKKILDDSYNTLHKMFAKTYGYIYLSHSNIFKEFYNSMKKYFNGETEDIGKHIDDFFRMLQERMLPMMEKASRTDANLRKCLLRELSRNRPFGDVPDTIKSGMRRTLVTSRTFIMVMSHMTDLLQRILDRVQATLSRDCINALTRLNMCPLCSGLQAQPCNRFCNNVMRGCLYQLYDIIPSWQRLIKAMQNLGERMSGPLSIEISLNSLGVKVSDGIMNFQKSYSDGSRSKLRKMCQVPRGKRSVPVMPAKGRSREKFGWKYEHGRELAKLVRQIDAEILQPQMKIWSSLMSLPCKKSESRCWNGSAVASYEHPLVRGTLLAQVSNPEVAVDTSLKDPTFDKAKYLMNRLTRSCKQALFNNEVNWIAPSPVTPFRPPFKPTNNIQREDGSGLMPSNVVRSSEIEASGSSIKPPLKSTNGPMPVTRPSKPNYPVKKAPPPDDESSRGDMPTAIEGSGMAPVAPTGDTRSGSSTRRTPSPTRKSSSTGRENKVEVRPPTPMATKPSRSQPERRLPERPREPNEGSGEWPNPSRAGRKPIEWNKSQPVQKPRTISDDDDDERREPEGSGSNGSNGDMLPERKDDRKWKVGKTLYPSQVWVPKNPDESGESNANYNVRSENINSESNAAKGRNAATISNGSCMKLVIILSVTILFLGRWLRTDG